MRFAIATALLGVAGLTVVAAAQTPPAAPAIARTLVAGIKLPSLGNTPLYFKAVSVSIPAGRKISLSAPNGILYQLSGSTEVSAGEAKTITSGGGVLIADGTTAALTAGNGEQSTLLFFLLAPREALDQPVAAAPATVNELYRTGAPLPELKPGSYELNLTRVTFPPGMPSNPPHHRSGAALYYIVSGIGAFPSPRWMLRLFSRRPQRTLQTRPMEERSWTSKIRILNGGFWRTNRSYRFSLPIWQKRNQDFWTGYRKYSRNTTHWALMSRTTPIQPHTQSSLSIT